MLAVMSRFVLCGLGRVHVVPHFTMMTFFFRFTFS